ncbi:hypothetical protein JW756_02230 [Candidatus Woesearchaeota archaeon]|nr:hypothetical protein [Candidatus Woesearchaeota archaeon]
MTTSKSNYSFAFIAIVAIVAIAGLVVMFIKGTGIEPTQEAIPEELAEQENLLGEATTDGASSLCQDSDGGKDYYTKGTTTRKGQPTKTDTCATKSNLREYFCNKGTISSQVIACKSGKCKDGACEQILCKDADPNNLAAIFIASTVTVGPTKTTPEKVYKDYCKNKNVLVEYSCDGGSTAVGTAEIYCFGGCFEGACKYIPCTDSDGGGEGQELIKGICKDSFGNYTDFCLLGSFDNQRYPVLENYCAPSYSLKGQELYFCRQKYNLGGAAFSFSNSEIDCAYFYGTECSDGACGKPSGSVLCSDSDSGKIPAIKGTVTKGIAKWEDYCHNTTWIHEYYCSAQGYPAEEQIICPEGKTCVDGACVKS